MDTTKESSTAEDVAVVAGGLLKTDVLGRVTVRRDQRETILDAFEASGMTGSAFLRTTGSRSKRLLHGFRSGGERVGITQNLDFHPE
jgi:hypothetical protein